MHKIPKKNKAIYNRCKFYISLFHNLRIQMADDNLKFEINSPPKSISNCRELYFAENEKIFWVPKDSNSLLKISIKGQLIYIIELRN